MKAEQARVFDAIAFALIVALVVIPNCVAQLEVRLILHWRRILLYHVAPQASSGCSDISVAEMNSPHGTGPAQGPTGREAVKELRSSGCRFSHLHPWTKGMGMD